MKRVPLFKTEDGVNIYDPNHRVYMVEKGSYSNNYTSFEASCAVKCGWAYRFSTRKAANIFANTKKLENAKKVVKELEKKLKDDGYLGDAAAGSDPYSQGYRALPDEMSF